jgi:hypothetical protein
VRAVGLAGSEAEQGLRRGGSAQQGHRLLHLRVSHHPAATLRARPEDVTGHFIPQLLAHDPLPAREDTIGQRHAPVGEPPSDLVAHGGRDGERLAGDRARLP